MCSIPSGTTASNHDFNYEQALSASALGLVSTPTEFANQECTGPTVLGGEPAFAGVER
jgi:hypothetical protein